MEGGTAMTTIITALSDVGTIVTEAFGVITGTPILLFFLAAGLLPVGFKVFKMAKKTAK